MDLKSRLEALIAEEGPLPVDRYMSLCLHDPTHGYYATRPALGADGDFITAPMVSQMFGELIGLWCAAQWLAMGSPPQVRWVEVGPGDGTLIADARRAIARAAPSFLEAADLWLVETSGPLRVLQRAALHPSPFSPAKAGAQFGHAGAAVRSRPDSPSTWTPALAGETEKEDGFDPLATWAGNLSEVPTGAPLILIANELLDCLPARQFLKDDAGLWAERRVGLDGAGRLAFGLSPPPRDFEPPFGLAATAPGVIVEASPTQEAFGAELGARIARDGGAALLIDYGRDRPEPGDTLQALHRHQKVDPLASPGEADLTVHADFPAVVAAAKAVGAAVGPILSQAELLARLGIGERALALAPARPDQAAAIARQLHRLTHPDEMGTLFKAIAIFRQGDPAPPAFEEPA